MGVYFEQHVQQRYPEFPVRTGVLSWEDYLPPMSPNLRRLVEKYGGAEEVPRRVGAGAGRESSD